MNQAHINKIIEVLVYEVNNQNELTTPLTPFETFDSLFGWCDKLDKNFDIQVEDKVYTIKKAKKIISQSLSDNKITNDTLICDYLI